MDEVLRQAHESIFGKKADSDLADWQIADEVMNNFSILLLGEDLAKAVILRIVNHTFFPNQERTTRLVAKAEAFAKELWPELSEEPHMAELEWLEHVDKK